VKRKKETFYSHHQTHSSPVIKKKKCARSLSACESTSLPFRVSPFTVRVRFDIDVGFWYIPAWGPVAVLTALTSPVPNRPGPQAQPLASTRVRLLLGQIDTDVGLLVNSSFSRFQVLPD
jgi:hypothetical protein